MPKRTPQQLRTARQVHTPAPPRTQKQVPTPAAPRTQERPRPAKPPPPDAPAPRRAVRGTTIETYRQRRDFSATAEPPPGEAPRSGAAPIFVVQKHDARRLHWDFRLEHGGVLWSWAVPKGPSLDPADKRLAVRTEDHPLEYADFSGIIPEGQYGAGTVETWDRGTWEPANGEPEAALAKRRWRRAS